MQREDQFLTEIFATHPFPLTFRETVKDIFAIASRLEDFENQELSGYRAMLGKAMGTDRLPARLLCANRVAACLENYSTITDWLKFYKSPAFGDDFDKRSAKLQHVAISADDPPDDQGRYVASMILWGELMGYVRYLRQLIELLVEIEVRTHKESRGVQDSKSSVKQNDGGRGSEKSLRTFTTGDLAAEIGVSTDTVNKYARLAQVEIAGRGKRNKHFEPEDVPKILKACMAGGGGIVIKAKCRELLAQLISETNPQIGKKPETNPHPTKSD